jgi:uncharacterized damage-inducible protein DinB
MSEISFIVDQLKLAFDGEAWHGPALMEILDGVNAKTAAARPLGKAHSIWELVLHISAWEKVVERRIHRQTMTLTDEQNFGHVARETEEAWQETIRTLRQNHSELIDSFSKMESSRLDEKVPGKDYDMRFMLTGAVQHVAYHAGQIALLKRARS